MTTPRRDNALVEQGEVGKSRGDTSANLTKKIDRVLEAIKLPAGLNRFEAERIGDHCLNSTVAALRAQDVTIFSQWETVPTRYSPKGVRVLRYWAGGASKYSPGEI